MRFTLFILAPLNILLFLFLTAPLSHAETRGPLANRPSKPGPHIERIKALRDNELINLGKPSPDPKWGLSYGRAWSPKMAYASDLEGAFIHGQGVHGFVKKEQNRVMDDVFFYDVNAHAWVCCYPGTHLPTVEQDWKVSADGFLVNKDGDSPPMVGLVHAYNNVTYSPVHRSFITLHGTGYASKTVSDLWTKRFPDPTVRRNHYHNRQHPYLYNVDTARWSRHDTGKNGPGLFQIYGTTLMWLPTKKSVLLHCKRNELWNYDIDGKTWSRLKPINASDMPSDYEGLSCYDPKRNRVHFLRRNKGKPGIHTIYDVKQNKWIPSTAKNQPDVIAGDQFDCNRGFAHYDTANDVLIWFSRSGKKPGAYVYNPGEDQWSAEPVLAEAPKGRHAFYSTRYNAHFFFEAGDSRTTPGNIWVWRYKRSSETTR